MAKPASKPDWTLTNPGVRTEPTPTKKNNGWAADERPAYQFFNWLFFNISEWIEYLETETDILSSAFDAVVAASGGTHTTLAAAIADAAIQPYDRILVKDPEDLSTTVEISKAGLEIYFAPSATFTDNGAGTGLRLSQPNIRLYNGRMTAFATTCIDLTAAAKNCRVQDFNFGSTVTTDITDAGTNNLFVNNLKEVV